MKTRRPHSYSSLSTLASCAEKYRLAYVEEIEDPSTNLPQAAGSALDAALNHLYVEAWEEAGALERLRESWGDTKAPFGARHAHLTLGFLEERVRVYMREREKSPTILEEGEIVRAFSGEMHEFGWASPETGEIVHVRGVPDLILRHEGKTWAVDVKCTTQWVNSYWLMQFRVGNQLRMYAAMIETLLNEKVSGGLINAVYMGDKALDDEAAWKKRKSAPSALHLIDFTPEQIADSWKWARGLEVLEAACKSSGLWPRNEKACGDYGGCEFLELCTAPSEMTRKARMLTQFKRRERR